ncbi:MULTISPECIES: pyrophosphatase PpaX [Paenibacillus]|uniref:pyrophosphatase PpaX n=1 Tax=Paenibacillus TaxID=44249 RepID=UPI00020D658D|nr:MULTISPECIES: pyrophosphatase PpaX [Paenibacillus]EGL14466.1 HAD hydrolase, family IA, variant 3 [Paenibacillus sp. HGF7]EPD85943.1 HAD hydrolase, family IA [Paenibacillus sp. HGH0039]MBV6716321.1 pyrophosphatase PpaX [Paenibacillus chitinolyticus]
MKHTVLFDLDGTILDTNELIIQSFLHALEGKTPELFTRDNIIPHMGRPLIEQLQFFSGLDEVTDLLTLYRSYNLKHHDELVRPFPYVKEVLAKLHAYGVKIGVVTSKIRLTTMLGLELCELLPYIQSIVTVDDVTNAKPDPEGIRKALHELGSTAEEAVMVGDSHYDIEAAKAAGVEAVAVNWSLKGQAYLEQYHPEHMIADMRELYMIFGITEESV